jgi:protein tyrosine phosphatase
MENVHSLKLPSFIAGKPKSETHTLWLLMEMLMIFHSAGCGRSGTFCTIDTVMRLLKKPSAFNYEKDLIIRIINTFRTQRTYMVQTSVSNSELEDYFSFAYTISTIGSI